MLLLSPIDGDLAKLKWGLAGGKTVRSRYLARREDGQTLYLHRIVAHRMGLIDAVVGAEGGRWTHSVDHINGNKLDNRRDNLRLRSRSEQMLNVNDTLRSTNTSGHRGVSFVKKRVSKPWMAHAYINGRSFNLGWFATMEGAVVARRAWDEARV